MVTLALFLDEIDSLPLLAQVKLLRFLQDREYKRLGSRKVCHADVRIIAAANVDLEEHVRAGKFRKDLYYRLNVINLNLPALRDRPGDIGLLVTHFLEKLATETGRPCKEFSLAAAQKLLAYDWPGNVRELQNMVERVVVLSHNPLIQEEEIPLPQADLLISSQSFQFLKAKAVAEFECKHILSFLHMHHGNITKAAQAAQLNRRVFWRFMMKHSITTSRSDQ